MATTTLTGTGAGTGRGVGRGNHLERHRRRAFNNSSIVLCLRALSMHANQFGNKKKLSQLNHTRNKRRIPLLNLRQRLPSNQLCGSKDLQILQSSILHFFAMLFHEALRPLNSLRLTSEVKSNLWYYICYLKNLFA